MEYSNYVVRFEPEDSLGDNEYTFETFEMAYFAYKSLLTVSKKRLLACDEAGGHLILLQDLSYLDSSLQNWASYELHS